MLSPTQQRMPQPLAGSSVAAALEDDLEDVQRVGGGWRSLLQCRPSQSSSSAGSKGCQSAIFEKICSCYGSNHVVGGWLANKALAE